MKIGKEIFPWYFTFNLNRLHKEEGLTYSNRIWLTTRGWAGLYLVNIVLFGYKLWFGFTKDYFLKAGWRNK